MFCSQLLFAYGSLYLTFIMIPITGHALNLFLTRTTYIPKSQRKSTRLYLIFSHLTTWAAQVTELLLDLILKVCTTRHNSSTYHKIKRGPPIRKLYYHLHCAARHKRPSANKRCYQTHQVSLHPLQRPRQSGYPPSTPAYQAYPVRLHENKNKGTTANRARPSNHYALQINSHYSYCVSNNKTHFIGDLEPMKATVQALQGTVPVHYKGEVQWSIEDDLGTVTTHRILNTLFIPSVQECIFSPQHWCQTRINHGDHTAKAIKGAKTTQLIWSGGDHIKTIPLDPVTNVTTMQGMYHHRLTTMPSAALVSDYEADEDDIMNIPGCYSCGRSRHEQYESGHDRCKSGSHLPK